MPRAAFAAPAVSISLPSVPERVEPNTPFAITVQYQMDLWKEGLRGRVFLETVSYTHLTLPTIYPV